MITPWEFVFGRMIPLTMSLECDAWRSGSSAVSVTCPIMSCAREPANTSLQGRVGGVASATHDRTCHADGARPGSPGIAFQAHRQRNHSPENELPGGDHYRRFGDGRDL